MGEQLFLERFVWFDSETRHDHLKLAKRFETSTKTVQRAIEYFRDCLRASLKYLIPYTDYRQIYSR